MKAYEILSERSEKKLSKNAKYSAPHAKQYQDIDQYYGMYRFGVAMAAAPDGETPKEGPAKDVPAVWMYSKGEEDIVKKAQKNQLNSNSNSRPIFHFHFFHFFRYI